MTRASAVMVGEAVCAISRAIPIAAVAHTIAPPAIRRRLLDIGRDDSWAGEVAQRHGLRGSGHEAQRHRASQCGNALFVLHLVAPFLTDETGATRPNTWSSFSDGGTGHHDLGIGRCAGRRPEVRKV